MSSHQSTERCDCCLQPVTSVCQTLEEIDFERGIWSAALNGDTERVKKFLSGDGNPDVPDSSSFTALVSELDCCWACLSLKNNGLDKQSFLVAHMAIRPYHSRSHPISV